MGQHVSTFLAECFNTMWRNKRGYSDKIIKTTLPKSLRISISMDIFRPMIDAVKPRILIILVV